MEYVYLDMISVAETGPFLKKASQILSDEEKSDLITYLSANPQSGVLIQNTGGIRKLRWAKSGGGKSGEVRVIYYFYSNRMPLYLLTVFGKNEKADISMKEKKTLSKLVKELVSFWS